MTLNIHSSEDARRIAQRRLPWMVFDYIDGAAGRETGAARNRAAFDALTLRPRILRDVSQRDLTSSVFGQKTNTPLALARWACATFQALAPTLCWRALPRVKTCR